MKVRKTETHTQKGRGESDGRKGGKEEEREGGFEKRKERRKRSYKT